MDEKWDTQFCILLLCIAWMIQIIHVFDRLLGAVVCSDMIFEHDDFIFLVLVTLTRCANKCEGHCILKNIGPAVNFLFQKIMNFQIFRVLLGSLHLMYESCMSFLHCSFSFTHCMFSQLQCITCIVLAVVIIVHHTITVASAVVWHCFLRMWKCKPYMFGLSAENRRRSKHAQKSLNPEWNQTVIYKNIHLEQVCSKFVVLLFLNIININKSFRSSLLIFWINLSHSKLMNSTSE